MTGIYNIINVSNNKRYIGSAVDISRRLKRHKQLLIKGNHINKKLQNAYNKHGDASFKFEAIEMCDKESLLIREGYFMDQFNSIQEGYNIELVDIDGNRNRNISQITRDRIRNTMTGVKHTEERKSNISKSKSGKRLSLQHIQNIKKSIPRNHLLCMQNLSKMKTSKPVIQQNLITGEVIRIYDSISAATRSTGTCSTYILNACKNRRNKTNYTWKYA